MESRDEIIIMPEVYQQAESIGIGSTDDDMAAEEAELLRLRDELKEKNRKLKLENEKLKKMDQKMMIDEGRYTSSSRDARKMYGDITPGDVTHQDVILLYQNHFKSAFRNIPKEFPEENKFKIWQMCSDIFRVCFEVKKEEIIDKMKEGIKESLNKDFGCEKREDNTRDLHRAFKMIISEINQDELKQKVKEMIPEQWNEEMFDFVLHVIQELDPVHYTSFLTSGKLQDRPAHLYYED